MFIEGVAEIMENQYCLPVLRPPLYKENHPSGYLPLGNGGTELPALGVSPCHTPYLVSS